jgi:hypothetical protein
MPSMLIAATRRVELEPLGTGGHAAISVAPALRAALLRSLSAEHAALLAEPVLNPAADEIDWYAELEAMPVPLPSLAPPARAEAEAALARLGEDVRGLADRLAASRVEGDRFLGQMLAFSLTVPDESHVLVAAGRPVLVGWGHRAAGPRQPNPLIIGTRAPVAGRMSILPPPPGILDTAVPEQHGGLWWLALALAALLWLLPAWLLARALAEPVPCGVAPVSLVLVRRLAALETAGARLRAELGVLRAPAAAPCPHAPVLPPLPQGRSP